MRRTAMTDRATPFSTFLTTALVVVALCQSIHWYLTSVVRLPVQVFTSPVLELNFVYSENRGMNFGLFAGNGAANQLILAGLAAVVCLLMAVILLRKKQVSHAIAGGMIVGGGLSNIFERLAFGYVFDYINTPVFGMTNPFSYNVADIFIVLPIAWWVFKS